MRIGYWKSGRAGVELTQTEVQQLGGIGAALALSIDTKKSTAAGPVFILRTTKDEGSLIHAKTKTVEKCPEYVAQARFKPGWNGACPDFGLMKASTEWDGKIGGYVIRPDWSQRKAARIVKRNGNGKSDHNPLTVPVELPVHATTGPKWVNQARNLIHALNKLKTKVGPALDLIVNDKGELLGKVRVEVKL